MPTADRVVSVEGPPSPPARGDGRLSPQVARLLRELIMSGEAPGHTRLRTEHLAERFGVSATPVREALMSLHGEGLVDFQPGRGFRVAPMTRQDVLDLYDAQAYFAGELAARAATRLTDRDLEQLLGLQEQFVDVIRTGDHAASEQVEFDLHKLINRAAAAPKLQWLLKLTMRYVPFRSWSEIPQWSTAAPQDHLPLLRGLSHRSPRIARGAMAVHVRNIAELLADLLEERGVLVQDDDTADRSDSRSVRGVLPTVATPP